MIDNFVILFTTALCMFVVFRAIRLDSKLPWFGGGARRNAVTRPAPRLAGPEDFGAAPAAKVAAPEPSPKPERWGGGWDRDPWEPRPGGAKRDAS